MKVNMALISDGNEELRDEGEEIVEDDVVEDESEKHSKLKTLLLVALMVGGFGLFVMNMTSFVNNMRLDNQGYASNIVYEMEDLGSFMNNADGSGSKVITGDEHTKSEVTTDAARDGPASYVKSSDEDDSALEKRVRDAENEAAFVKQELKNAEEMLDASLSREAQLQSQLDKLTDGN